MTATLVPVAIAMPKLSDSMEEGTIVKWLKAPGDTIARGEPLVEVETDKATITYEAETAGVLGELLVAEGESAALGAAIAQLLVEDAPGAPATAPPAAAAVPPSGGGAPSVAPTPAPSATAGDPTRRITGHSGGPPAGRAAPSTARGALGRVRATPVARRIAADLGVALGGVQGSGPRGRIVRADVLAAAEQAGSAAAVPGAHRLGAAPEQAKSHADAAPGTAHAAMQRAGAGSLAANGAMPANQRVELSATQRTIARRMVASRTEIPEFTLTAEIDMTAALELRRQLSALNVAARVSVNDLVVKAAALVLREQPRINASWAEDHIVRHGQVNIGIAVAADDALIVPVVRGADRLHVAEISSEARRLGLRARNREVSAEELSGATFTVSNLGMFGVLSFDAVIDMPQAAILAVGTVVRRPAFDDDGGLVGRDLMQVSLSCDHRVVYGADGARFLKRLRAVLENPMTLLMPPQGDDEEGDRR